MGPASRIFSTPMAFRKSSEVLSRALLNIAAKCRSPRLHRPPAHCRRLALTVILLLSGTVPLFAQSSLPPDNPAFSMPPAAIELTVPEGVPLHVSLKKPLNVRVVGQTLQAYLTEPVYAFDRVVIPKGSELDGRIVALLPPSKRKRAGYYLNADFSPHRTVQVQFAILILPSGLRIPVQTKIAPDVGVVMRLEANPQNASAGRARSFISNQWHSAIAQAKPSALWKSFKHLLSSEWPYHKQKFPAGTVFVAELEQPLDFGAVRIPSSEEQTIGLMPSANTLAFARLTVGLNSAIALPGAPVDAVLTRPVFSKANELLLPVGARLEGTVVRAKPARSLHRNGRLLFRLDRVKLPSGISHPIEMSLQGVEVPQSSRLRMNSEGEASVADSKESRVLRTAFSAAIATSTFDSDSGHAGATATSENRPLGGLSGYKLIGLAIAFGARSPILSRTLGVWGTAQSLYLHFIGPGKNLVLPKNTPIEISFGEYRKPLHHPSSPLL